MDDHEPARLQSDSLPTALEERGANAFAFALYDHVVAVAGDSNVFLSPTSAALALALATEGAGGSTRAALARTLGVEDLSSEEFTRRNAALIRSLASTEQVTLVVANAFWGDTDVPFDKSFATHLAADYEATVETIDLQSSDFPSRANAWVSRKTAGRISTLVDAPLDGGAVLFLANAVYFKGKWNDAFEPSRTTPAPFLLPNGQSRAQPFMRREGSYAYFADSTFRIARLPYRGDRLAMYVILPANVTPITVHRPTDTWFSAALRRLAPTELAVAMPRFVLRYTALLNAPLAGMGAGPAFKPGADFTRLIPASVRGSRSISISKVLQQTYVEVNEEGTEAAATTSIEEGDSAGPPTLIPFVVDHPFVVIIRDDKTGALLFVGQITDPGTRGA